MYVRFNLKTPYRNCYGGEVIVEACGFDNYFPSGSLIMLRITKCNPTELSGGALISEHCVIAMEHVNHVAILVPREGAVADICGWGTVEGAEILACVDLRRHPVPHEAFQHIGHVEIPGGMYDIDFRSRWALLTYKLYHLSKLVGDPVIDAVLQGRRPTRDLIEYVELKKERVILSRL